MINAVVAGFGVVVLLALGACRSKMGSIETIANDELSAPCSPPEGSWTGTLEHVRFRSHQGCTDPEGTLHEWLVVRIDDRRMPIRIGTAEQLKAVRVDRASHRPRPFPTAAAESSAPLLTPAEGAKRGIVTGDRVRLGGVCVPLLFSGSIGMAPVYGIFTANILEP